MAREKLREAQQLLKAKRYDEARSILVTLDDPTARKWLARLDQIEPVKSDPSPKIHSASLSSERTQPMRSITMSDPSTRPTKRCPYCAEDILAEAIVCRYCGRNLETFKIPAPPQPKPHQFAGNLAMIDQSITRTEHEIRELDRQIARYRTNYAGLLLGFVLLFVFLPLPELILLMLVLALGGIAYGEAQRNKLKEQRAEEIERWSALKSNRARTTRMLQNTRYS